MMTLYRFSFILFLLATLQLQAQVSPSRSGFPALPETRDELRFFPCGGETLYEEFFRADSLPAGWRALKLDSGTVHTNIQDDFDPGWQSIQDFKNPNARSVASPSWYNEDSIQSDNWLITPKFSLGDNSCFSWFAYSQDRNFEESYEVRISLTTPTPDSAGFLAEPALLEIAEEENGLNYRSVNLAAYAGMDVYIAFRQTSTDKFILVLDDVRLAEVELKDIGIINLEQVNVNLGDTVNFQAGLRNYGSDTLSLDSTIFVVYTLNGGDTTRSRLLDDTTFINLSPNDSLQFTHPVSWIPEDSGIFQVCMWTEWAPDTVYSNDTSCNRAGVNVNITAIEKDRIDLPVTLYPNPANDELNLEWKAQRSALQLNVYDAIGRLIISEKNLPAGTGKWQLGISNLPRGTYNLLLWNEEGIHFSSKFIKR